MSIDKFPRTSEGFLKVRYATELRVQAWVEKMEVFIKSSSFITKKRSVN